VDVSIQELKELYRKCSDEELLLYVQGGTLTPMASKLATAELHSRGIEPQPAALASEETADGSEEADLVTVAEFSDATKGTVLQARLESEGISASVWTPVVSGGITRVQVRSDHVEQAREVMSAIEGGELAISDSPDTKTAAEERPGFARRAARVGAVPFTIWGVKCLIVGGPVIRTLIDQGVPRSTAAGVGAFVLVAGAGFLYLAWRTYRNPSLPLVSLATFIAGWNFISALRTHTVTAVYVTTLVSALIGLYYACVVKIVKNSKTGDPSQSTAPTS